MPFFNANGNGSRSYSKCLNYGWITGERKFIIHAQFRNVFVKRIKVNDWINAKTIQEQSDVIARTCCLPPLKAPRICSNLLNKRPMSPKMVDFLKQVFDWLTDITINAQTE